MKYLLSIFLILSCQIVFAETESESVKLPLLSLAASNKDNSHEIANLVEEGVDINQQRKKDGLSAIHLAALQGNVENLKALIASGADVNIQDIKGHSPLDFTTYQDKEYSEVLINAGGKRYKQWGSRKGNIFFEGTRVFNVVYFFAIFWAAFLIIRIVLKKYNARIMAFGVLGLSYLFLILAPQVNYSGINGLIYIGAHQYLYAIIPLAIGIVHLSPWGSNEQILKASVSIVNCYIALASLSCFALIVLLVLIGETS